MLRDQIEAITRALPAGFKNRIRATVGDVFRFNHTLTSGIAVTVRRPSDFSTYSEIFVDGFYDTAIHDAINNSEPQINLLDLGSNVGYFGHRFADLLRRTPVAASRSVHLTMIEGAEAVAEESRFRLRQNGTKIGDCEVIYGLVGQKSGFGTISIEYNYGYNSVVGGNALNGVRTPFYDLTPRLASTTFDLIKCDIEGAEQMFIETYADLLDRQPRLVFEFHHHLCDTAKCDRLLKQLGFALTTVSASDEISMVYYHRDS